mmetsp:Transcript_5457/g.17315  ORF Transcript_5457/g.17315 Transcript_5457/m.17315 type:complete len:257 (-) Transcript_5457:118-888(-)
MPPPEKKKRDKPMNVDLLCKMAEKELECRITTKDGTKLEARTANLKGGSVAVVMCPPLPPNGNCYVPEIGVTQAKLALAGYCTVRFNFRGVGASEGATYFRSPLRECEDVRDVLPEPAARVRGRARRRALAPRVAEAPRPAAARVRVDPRRVLRQRHRRRGRGALRRVRGLRGRVLPRKLPLVLLQPPGGDVPEPRAVREAQALPLGRRRRLRGEKGHAGDLRVHARAQGEGVRGDARRDAGPLLPVEGAPQVPQR